MYACSSASSAVNSVEDFESKIKIDLSLVGGDAFDLQPAAGGPVEATIVICTQ